MTEIDREIYSLAAALIYRASFFAECERDEHGRCRPGTGGGKKPSTSRPGTSRPASGADITIGPHRQYTTGEREQRHAEGMQDKLAAQWPHAKAIPGNAPSDVEQITSCCRQQVELKTLLVSKRGNLRMSSAAMARKMMRLDEGPPPPVRRLWTVALDHRTAYSQGTLDKAAVWPMCIREGCGSFDVKSMHKVNSAADLERLVRTPADKLPPAARAPSKGFYAKWRAASPKKRQAMAQAAFAREKARLARKRKGANELLR